MIARFCVFMTNINRKLKIASFAVIAIMVASGFSHSALASEITVANVIKLVNQARETQGVMDLQENNQLDAVAQDKLNDMVKNDYFAHTSPQGINPWYWFQKEGYDYKYAGENLAINFTQSEDQQKAWMDSATHRQNILNANYQQIGVAVGAGEIDNQMGIITVQEFGTLAGAAAVPGNSQNFSSQNNIIKGAEVAGVPQVLSMKDFVGQKLTNNDPLVGNNGNLGFWVNLEKNEAQIYLWLSLVAVIAMVGSTILASASFLAVAVDDIRDWRKLKLGQS